jgi:hypothetical protein
MQVASIPGMYRPKHLEERLRRYHVRQLTHQIEELGIQSSGSSRSTPKPRLETLESGHEYHTDESASFSTSTRDEHHDGDHHHHPSAAHKHGSHDPPVLKHHPPNRHPQAVVMSQSAHGDFHGTPADEDIHRHGVGAIDQASKYLSKHNLDRGDMEQGDGEASPRSSSRASIPVAAATAPKKSPRPSHLSSTETGDVLTSSSACPSPRPSLAVEAGAINIFPQRSVSEGVQILKDDRSNQSLQSSLPPIGRPGSASSTNSQLSARKTSPRAFVAPGPEPLAKRRSSKDHISETEKMEKAVEEVINHVDIDTSAETADQESPKREGQGQSHSQGNGDDTEQPGAPGPPSPHPTEQMEVDEACTHLPQASIEEDSVHIVDGLLDGDSGGGAADADMDKVTIADGDAEGEKEDSEKTYEGSGA